LGTGNLKHVPSIGTAGHFLAHDGAFKLPDYTVNTWRDAYVLPLAANGTRGGAQIGYVENDKNYPVELLAEQMFVNVPWTDTNLTNAEVIAMLLTGYVKNSTDVAVVIGDSIIKGLQKIDYRASEAYGWGDHSGLYLAASLKGASNGLAELDGNGLVPSSQLPSYVDDVIEAASTVSFPATGESGKIYVALDTNKTYRWSGTVYIEISASLALGETSSTAYRGDRGKIAYDHSQVAHAPSNANYITNNNQLTNGAGYITSYVNTQLTNAQVIASTLTGFTAFDSVSTVAAADSLFTAIRKLEHRVNINDSATLVDANATNQGNTFNGNDELVQLNATGQLPAIDGSLLTGLAATTPTQDTAPLTPDEGDLWWDSINGKLKIYYNDGTSSQWVDATPIADLASELNASAIKTLYEGNANTNAFTDVEKTKLANTYIQTEINDKLIFNDLYGGI